MSKPRVIKDYNALDEGVIRLVKLNYPSGYEKHLITFKNKKKHLISALPFEAEDRYYLIRMTRAEAQKIISADADFDHNGELKSASKLEFENLIVKEAV